MRNAGSNPVPGLMIDDISIDHGHNDLTIVAEKAIKAITTEDDDLRVIVLVSRTDEDEWQGGTGVHGYGMPDSNMPNDFMQHSMALQQAGY